MRTETHLIPAFANAKPRRLMVVVPGAGQTTASWKPLLDRLEKDLPETEWLLYDHHRTYWSSRSINSLAVDLAARINERYENFKSTNHRPYEGITLIGHSLGAILTRKAYLLGSGRGAGSSTRDWGSCVDRIILFSALNRGVDPDRVRCAGIPLGMAMRTVALFPRFRVIREYMKGSSFMTDLRISWIQHFRQFAANSSAAAAGGAAGGRPQRQSRARRHSTAGRQGHAA